MVRVSIIAGYFMDSSLPCQTHFDEVALLLLPSDPVEHPQRPVGYRFWGMPDREPGKHLIIHAWGCISPHSCRWIVLRSRPEGVATCVRSSR